MAYDPRERRQVPDMQTNPSLAGRCVGVRGERVFREISGGLRNRRADVHVEATKLLHPLLDPATTADHDMDLSTRVGSATVNSLQLDRDKLLRWDRWGGRAKAFLGDQEEYFDLAPIVERYVNEPTGLRRGSGVRSTTAAHLLEPTQYKGDGIETLARRECRRTGLA